MIMVMGSNFFKNVKENEIKMTMSLVQVVVFLFSLCNLFATLSLFLEMNLGFRFYLLHWICGSHEFMMLRGWIDVESEFFFLAYCMNIDEFCMNMKKWWNEEHEEREKIMWWWFTIVYIGHAIEWLKSYQKCYTLKN